MRLEELSKCCSMGILPNQVVTVVDVKWFGSDVVELTLEILTQDRPWSFNADGSLLRLVSEAHRIRLAHLFDPLLAVHTSLVEPGRMSYLNAFTCLLKS